MTDAIEKSIHSKTALSITYRMGGGTSTIDFTVDAYLLGKDAMGYDFVWGFVQVNCIFYKFYLDNVVDLKNTSIKQLPINGAVTYQYTTEEQLYAWRDDFFSKMIGITV